LKSGIQFSTRDQAAFQKACPICEANESAISTNNVRTFRAWRKLRDSSCALGDFGGFFKTVEGGMKPAKKKKPEAAASGF
jgi:hypothetical protein